MSSVGQLYRLSGGVWTCPGRTGGAAAYNPLTFTYGAFDNFSYTPDGSIATSAKTAGIPYGSPALTTQNGTSGLFIISVPGIYDLIDFHCEVSIRCSGVIFTRCKFRGNTTRSSGNGALANIGGSAPYGVRCATFYDCDFIPDQPMVWWDAIMNHDYAAYRCFVSGTVDGFGVFGNGTGGSAKAANVKLYGNHVYKLSYFATDDLNHNLLSGETITHTHNDCVQWQGGANLTAVGNNWQCYIDSAIGEASYSSGSPHVTGGGPNNAGGGSGYNVNYPSLNSPSNALQISNLVGGECSGLDWHHNTSAGGVRHLTLSQTYTSLGVMHDNKSVHDQLDTAHTYNVKSGMTTGSPAPLTITNDKYTDGTPVVVNLV